MPGARRAALLASLAIGAIALALATQHLPEAPRDRPPPMAEAGREAPNIGVFGTSLTARATWPRELQEALRVCGFAGARVVPLGQPGAGSAAGLATVTELGDAPLDIAIVEYAINDADLWDGVSPGKSLSAHRQIIARLRSLHPGIAIVLLTTNPVSGVQRLKRPRLMAYYAGYAKLAESENVGLVDGTARWRGVPLDGAALPDGLHPDPGTEAALYLRPLSAAIGRALGGSCPG